MSYNTAIHLDYMDTAWGTTESFLGFIYQLCMSLSLAVALCTSDFLWVLDNYHWALARRPCAVVIIATGMEL